MSKKLLSVLLVSLLVLSPIAVASASESGFQNHKVKAHDNTIEKLSKKDHKETAKVNDRDDDHDDDDDDENDGTPASGTIYSITATGDATKKAKGEGHGDKKDDDHSKGKDKDKGKDKKTTEVKPASLSLKSEVKDSSEGRIKLKILSGTLKIGDTTYDIEEGKGKINKKNDKIEFKAEAFTGGDDFELVLKGNHGGNVPENPGDASTSVEFTSPQSKLASKWFLHLSGNLVISGTAPPPPPPPAVNRTTLAIAKSVNASTTLGLGTLRYLITFTNTGNSTARNINVTDTLPASVALVSTNGSIILLSGSTIRFAAGNLSKGASKSIVILVSVAGTTPDRTALRNNASIVWRNIDGSVGGPVSAMAVTTIQAPSLQILKRVDVSSAVPGNALLYTIRINNSGSAVATTVNLNDTLPANVTLLSTSLAPNSMIGNTLMWSFVLAPNGTITITILVRVNSGIGPQILTNTARAIYQNSKAAVFPAISSQASTSILSVATMSLQKSVNATSALRGSGLRYILAFANTGNGTARNVNITDTLPSYVTFILTNGTGASIASSGHTITFSLGNISASSGGKIAIIVKVNGTTPDQTVLRNNATLQWKNPDGSVAMVSATASTTVNEVALMSLQKTVNATTAIGGAGLKYTLIFANSGNGTARKANITDTLPSHVTFVSTNGTVISTAGKTMKFGIGNVSSSTGGRIIIIVKVNGTTPDQTALRNNATLEWKNPNGSIGTASATASTIVNAPVLQIAKKVNATAAIPGNTLLYTISINNTGGATARINLTDIIPNNTTRVSESLTPDSIIGRSLSWLLSLASQGKIIITVAVKVIDGIVSQTLTNIATATFKNENGVAFPQVSSQASTNITGVSLMTLQKGVNATASKGGDGLKYELEFRNVGNQTARKVNITDTLPSHSTFVSTNGTVLSMSGHILKLSLGNVTASARGKIIIIVRVNGTTPDQTVLRNNATLEWKNPNGSVSSTNSSASTTVNAPALMVIKTVNATIAHPNNHLFYNITIVNNGHADAMISLNDTLPSGVTLVTESLAPNILTPNSLVWNTLTQAPSGKITITVLVQVNTGTLGTITNKATVTYKNANSIEFPQVSDQKSTLITAP